MKKFRKLIPALCMLLISAVLLGTSTFAWFSMNTTVTATGMQVTAKSNFTYLLIGKTSAEVKGEGFNKTEADFAMATGEANLSPSAHDTLTNAADVTELNGEQYKYWYTSKSSDRNQSVTDDSTKTYIGKDNLGDYVLNKTVYLALAPGSVKAASIKAKVEITAANTVTGAAKTIAPVKVLVVTANGVYEFGTGDTNATEILTNLESTSSAEAGKVEIYIYYDGTNEAVTTNNFANLDGAGVKITFEAVTAAA